MILIDETVHNEINSLKGEDGWMPKISISFCINLLKDCAVWYKSKHANRINSCGLCSLTTWHYIEQYLSAF